MVTINKETFIKTLSSEKKITNSYAERRIDSWIRRGKIVYNRAGHSVMFDLVEARKLIDAYKPRKYKTLSKTVQAAQPELPMESPKLNSLIKPITWKWINAAAKNREISETEVMAKIINKYVSDRIVEQAARGQ